MRNGLAGLVLAALAVAGCATSTSYALDTRVSVAPELYQRLVVRDIRLARSAGGQATMQASVVNNDHAVNRLAYRVVWFDAAGCEIPSVTSTWQLTSLAPLEVGSLTATAPSTEAVDFRFHVKEARNMR